MAEVEKNTATVDTLLTFLATHGPWVSLLEIDRTRLLPDDAVVVVPTLVEQGLVTYHHRLRAVRLTAKGRKMASRVESA